MHDHSRMIIPQKTTTPNVDSTQRKICVLHSLLSRAYVDSLDKIFLIYHTAHTRYICIQYFWALSTVEGGVENRYFDPQERIRRGIVLNLVPQGRRRLAR